MNTQRVVVALGGNAFAVPGEELTMARQFEVARQALAGLLELADHQLVLTHGNGPQVGHMLTRVEAALGQAYAVPLEVCVAETEGELGYVIQQTLYNLFAERGRRRAIATLLTEVLVDPSDPSFRTPTKPVGPFYSASQARELEQRQFHVVEDSGRGYRRVVPSPRPIDIVETRVIELLLEAGVLVVAAGGGGIPVVERDGRLEGVEAVVDKDLSSALLGEKIAAGLLLIVTGVPCAYLDYGTPRQTALGRLDPDEAQRYLEAGHFPAGSMGPKIEAAIRFSRRPGATAIICDPHSITSALRGDSGTRIVRVP